ncbi:CotH kinase family protein [Peribacillus sp. SCS-37]|uniref:CotH kinase family protein n=1 Tax=Paraperibacillus esterisolvens TaxID=3115296 RepID=UPI003906BBAA
MLKSYKLYIQPSELQTLNKDIWSDDPVPGTLKHGEKKYLIDVAYRGDSIRKNKKKSYQITFRKPYVVEKNHVVHLNSEYKDPSLIRNKLSLDFFRSLGILTPNAQHVLLILNGQCRGIYLELESFDEFFLKKWNLPEGGIFYATDNDANFSLLTEEEDAKTEILQGYTEVYDSNGKGGQLLSDLIFKINTLTNLEFEREIPKMIDVEKYLKWLAGVVCTQNFDGFIHNYALYWNSGTGLFEISPWDCDGTWGRNRHGELLPYDYIPIEGYNTLSARLLHHSGFRDLYKQIMEDILLNFFTEERLKPLIYSELKKLQPWIEKDIYIKEKMHIILSEPLVMLDFVRDRREYLARELVRLF